MLFMKGTPCSQCGFTLVCVQVLSNLGIQFKGVNVLEDEEVREGIKAYSNWPTIPQLTLRVSRRGGRDIVRRCKELENPISFNTNGINIQLANPDN